MSVELDYSFESPEQTLAYHGKSFYWASKLMPSSCREDALKLYSFCRFVDDCVDEAPNEEQAKQNIKLVREDLKGRNTRYFALAHIIELIEKNKVSEPVVHQLINGVASDLNCPHIEHEKHLIEYCYGVASTVGIMMAQIMGVTDRRAFEFAIDMGIAMQLSNIARDVQEDALSQRIYIPKSWLPLSHKQINDPSHSELVFNQVVRLIELADSYYDSANLGLCYLPIQARTAIHVAMNVYRAIGHKILLLGQDEYFKHKRCFTTRTHKLYLTVESMVSIMLDKRLYSSSKGKSHNEKLHRHITELIDHAL